MQILIEEMGLCDTVDPLGGSYYVETLTNQMEARIRGVMQDVDEQGGIVRAISDGRIQNTVSKQAYERLRKIERGEIRKVGTNCYQTEEEAEQPVAFHPFDEAACAEQVRRLNTVRAERDDAKARAMLRQVSSDAKAGRNVMPAVIEAIKAYATVGELTRCFVEVYGRYDEPVRF
jgi:methylmalonyl-CoA mutase N-terminal domain/subunit